MSNALSIQPENLAQAKELASMMAGTQLVPKAYQGKPADVLVCMMLGYELGLNPMQSLQNIAVINGKPSMYGDAMLALVKKHPDFESIQEAFDAKTMSAWCSIKRRGQPMVEHHFTQSDAERAKLWTKPGPWKEYPKRMLQMRARGFALRDAFPDALLGLVTAEEARDTPDDSLEVLTDNEVAAADLNATLKKQIADQSGEQSGTVTVEDSDAASGEVAQGEVAQGEKSENPYQSYADVAEAIKAAKSKSDATKVFTDALSLVHLDRVEIQELDDLAKSLYPK